jgi:hypothetical protein
MRILKTGLMSLLVIPAISSRAAQQPADTTILQLIFISDVHFGITRPQFDGDREVASNIVNTRLVKKLNNLPRLVLSDDGGLGAGRPVGSIDYFIETGDIANRQEVPYQSATTSWAQFSQVYLQGLTLKDHKGRPLLFLLTPGNHDVSDAIGFYRKMEPARDPASMVALYNLMLHPATPKTNITYHYPADKINYSKEIGGVHFLFINIWPDSANRIWMEKDLQQVPAGEPVILFCHDPPEGDAAHFTNPHGDHDINDRDRFENLLEETSKDALPTAKGKPSGDRMEQEGLVTFLKGHPNIRAWFHGHENWNEFYTYKGPGHDIALPTFRVDSPMKGKYSAQDETLLSFQLITLDTAARKMTVRECLWNPDPSHPDASPRWGESKTFSLE